MSNLGPDWIPDEEGYPHREAARIVLLNNNDEILLVHGHDAVDPQYSWWFTIGGGLEAGESPAEGAVRELYEETGICLSADDLIGPVLRRHAQFEFLAETARQSEWYFVAYVDKSVHPLSSDGWTELEQNVIDEQRWWKISDLDELSQTSMLTPFALPEYAPRWAAGWDGECPVVWEGRPAPEAKKDETVC